MQMQKAGSEDEALAQDGDAQSQRPKPSPHALFRRQSILRFAGRLFIGVSTRLCCSTRSLLAISEPPLRFVVTRAHFLQGQSACQTVWACRPATRPTRPKGAHKVSGE